MLKRVSYVVISPVRDEQEYLPLTIKSMAAQTVLPRQWIVVDDGSRDETGKILSESVHSHSWMRMITRPDRGFRKAGGGVVDAFYEGYRLIEREPWDFLVKLDGDLSFDPNYFELCFQRFEQNSKLGIGGGTICNALDGAVDPEAKGDPRFHVRGATKIYRRTCWEQLGGLVRAPGWDTLDEVKANMLGWETGTFSEIELIQHRPTGAAYGAWNDRVKAGLANYVTGYHPLFMLLKCVKRMARKPYVVGGCGLFAGFLKGYASGTPQVQDTALIKYLRQQQLNRLLGRKNLWSSR